MAGQKVRITNGLTQLTAAATIVDPTTASEVIKNVEFKIVIKSLVGSVLEIERIQAC